MLKKLPAKRKFEFEPAEFLCDVYVDGMKIRNGHNGRTGQVYLHIPEDADVEVEIKPHDPRQPVEVIATADGIEPYVDEAAIIRQQEEEQKKQLEAMKEKAKQEAAEKIKRLQQERFEKAKKSKGELQGGVLPSPVAPE